MRRLLTLGGLLAGLIVLTAASTFVVDQTQYAIVLRFGQPVRTLLEAGLYAKLPFPIDIVERFDNRLRILDPKPAEFLTRDKKNLIVDSYLVWKVEDPLQYLLSIGRPEIGDARLSDILAAELGAVLGATDFGELITTETGSSHLEELQRQITSRCARRSRENYGMDVIEVRIKRLSFPDQNLESVFGRMRAERARIATGYRSEGEEEAAKIRAKADREARELVAQAYQEAERIKGEGDAEAIRLYAQSFQADPQFYRFLRTLQAFERILDDRATLILSAQSDLFRLLEGPEAIDEDK